MGNHKTNNICQHNFNECYYTTSLSHSISAVIFILAIYTFLKSVMCNVPISLNQIHDPILIKTFKIILLAFVITFSTHLLRIYMSMLIMDEDAEYCNKFLRYFSKYQRIFDWILRFAILLLLVVYVTYYSSSFLLVMILYFLLISWDILMFLFVRYNTKKGTCFDDTYGKLRTKYFSNDFIGLIVSVLLFVMEIFGVYKTTIIYFSFFIGILCLLLIIFLIYDMFKNKQKYLKYLMKLLPIKGCNL